MTHLPIQLYTKRDAAKMLGVSERTLHRMVKRGDVKTYVMPSKSQRARRAYVSVETA